ncbi:hypothetical protein [Mucilaginibacter flavidus]|uniref:hypothetical protein n=1 Tax=Mucilaginibacter flavidus TaxID=2949309 RepID=UPI00209245E1|nr:hypothetical protein [Mucilaginibacter flavidus]MCO5945286.1 hypothetical protein [Mucilaginibacter flavidus]
MNTFNIKTVIKGLETDVVVKEPLKWDMPEFLISFKNRFVEDSFFIRLDNGLWQNAVSKEPQALNTINNNSSHSLEPLEVEAIGLEIAKCWIERLYNCLDIFERLF